MSSVLASLKSVTWPVRSRVGSFVRLAKVHARWILRGVPRRSSPLPSPLVISLTSFPPRYTSLELTLKCLLTQSIKCDRVVLWIAAADAPLLPRSVLELEQAGLTIAICEDDTRSYKKIIHSVVQYQDAFVLTADDDVYYWRTWAEELATAFRDPKLLVAHRCHRVVLGEDGSPKPYGEWEQSLLSPDSGPLLFPTGVGGVLYPPKTFDSEFFDVPKFRRLAPLADDVWIFWMARRAGRRFAQIGGRRKFWPWESSQTVSLMNTNVGGAGGNDRQLGNLIAEYGWPPQKDE